MPDRVVGGLVKPPPIVEKKTDMDGGGAGMFSSISHGVWPHFPILEQKKVKQSTPVSFADPVVSPIESNHMAST